MSRHLSHRVIEEYVAGTLSGRESRDVEAHFSRCGECRETAGIYKMLTISVPTREKPSPRIMENIIREWNTVRNETEVKINDKRGILRFSAGLASAAAVVIAVSYILFGGLQLGDVNYRLEVSSISGDVKINGGAAEFMQELDPGDVVMTSEGSFLKAKSDGYTLTLESSSSIRVNESAPSADFSFTLGSGSVLSESEGAVRYFFDSAGYRVTPAGTVFRLDSSDGKLAVFVMEGSAAVTGKGVSVEIPSGMRWSSEKADIVEKIEGAASVDGEKIRNGGEVSGRKNHTEEDGNAEKKEASRIDKQDTDKRDIKELRLRNELREMKNDHGRDMRGRGR